VGKNPENKVLDLGPQGPSQGDIRVTNAPLYDESGKETIGRFDLLCAITDPADEPAEKTHMAQCTKTFTLPGGQISVEGVEAYPNLSGLAPGVNAISGGTGKYAGVRGEQRFEVRGKGYFSEVDHRGLAARLCSYHLSGGCPDTLLSPRLVSVSLRG
jgi:hypothetical protein